MLELLITFGNSALFRFKQKATGTAGGEGTKNIALMVLLKQLSNFGDLLKWD